jgi:hypothetical protein
MAAGILAVRNRVEVESVTIEGDAEAVVMKDKVRGPRRAPGDDDGGDGVRTGATEGDSDNGVGEVPVEMSVDGEAEAGGVAGSLRSELLEVVIKGGGDAHVVILVLAVVMLRGETDNMPVVSCDRLGALKSVMAAAAETDAGETMVVMRDETGEAWVTLCRAVGVEEAREPARRRPAGATGTGRGATSSKPA